MEGNIYWRDPFFSNNETHLIKMNLDSEKIVCFSSKGKFFFFAYAIDMDVLNIKVHYPNAIKRAVACLCNHKLVFKNESSFWKSAIASIEPAARDFVWGVVWELDYSALCNYSREVPKALVYVEVITMDGYTVICGTHQIIQCSSHGCYDEDYFDDDDDSLPSQSYLLRIVNAALEAQLPPPYILGLSTRSTNRSSDSESGIDSSMDSEDTSVLSNESHSKATQNKSVESKEVPRKNLASQANDHS